MTSPIHEPILSASTIYRGFTTYRYSEHTVTKPFIRSSQSAVSIEASEKVAIIAKREPETKPPVVTAERELVGRILVSPNFTRSERLSTLLTYVCNMTFNGRSDEINEQHIGHAVFGRSADYDSSVDGIVRTQASRLRQRLDLYFQHEGASEQVLLAIPRGSYVPVFELREPPAALAQLPPVTPANTPPVTAFRQPAPSIQWLPWTLSALLLAITLLLGLREHRLAQGCQPSPCATPALESPAGQRATHPDRSR